jgi:ABC-type nitrate/sulfonate/bicarbonate transport system substrate-binding protein
MIRHVTALLVCVALALAPGGAARAAATIEYGSVGGPSAVMWPLYIANAQGMFAAEELAVDIAFAPSSAAVQQQLAAGSVQLADGGLNDPIRAIFEGAPIAIVRIEGQVPPYALLAKPAIKSLAELRGKTVIIGGAKDITLTYLARMLAPSGLKPEDCDLTFAGATIARLSALQSGAVDAAMLFPPFNFHAEAAGFTNLGLVYDYAKDMPFLGLVANRPWAAQNQATLAKFLAVYTKAVAWFDDDKNRAEAVRIMVGVSHQTQDDTEKSYDLYRKIGFFEPKGDVSRKKMEVVIDTIRSDFGDKPIDVNKLFLAGVTHVTD